MEPFEDTRHRGCPITGFIQAKEFAELAIKEMEFPFRDGIMVNRIQRPVRESLNITEYSAVELPGVL
jgi:hypothetical protein